VDSLILYLKNCYDDEEKKIFIIESKLKEQDLTNFNKVNLALVNSVSATLNIAEYFKQKSQSYIIFDTFGNIIENFNVKIDLDDI
jgi:hypothetical protein